MLTIGIPSKGSSPRILKIAQNLSMNPKINSIFVSINPVGIQDSDISKSLIKIPKVQLFIQDIDLGLYGNFHFLLKKVETKYFQWHCLDDTVTSNLELLLNKMEEDDTDLAIPTWCHQEWNPDTDSHFGEMEIGPLPRIENRNELVQSALNVQPSWIFGIWRTDFLKQVFPCSYFDWLDVHILQKVVLIGKVQVVHVDTPTVIGTWNWSNKQNHSVRPKGAKVLKYIGKSLYMIPHILRVDIALMERFMQNHWSFVKYAYRDRRTKKRMGIR